ncbi:hypothetical protein HPC49_50160 [Pyxidicoccus fallax]|uniref:Uncharacterized protein n=1 Tax=Pyxidicoccus fallax TaxID=394095 RepID=A0A848LDU6_9BACT|nr:hypothetical protein [Pyxidicoccus fallax]NMO16392.1 hypothetical protein [Pyxidicoccus fallax]NPC86339.1 hypothetical protein [Pyxidicoccus fallax]
MAPSLFDDAGYQDVPNFERSTQLDAADDRTLRMAYLPVDGALLDSLVRYLRTYVSHAEAGKGTEALVRAHSEALTASGLDSKKAEQGTAILRAFSGRRWAAQKLQDKLRQIEGQTGATVEELREKLREELTKQETATEALARRYGADTLALLRSREPELLDLHTRLTRLLSRG